MQEVSKLTGAVYDELGGPPEQVVKQRWGEKEKEKEIKNTDTNNSKELKSKELNKTNTTIEKEKIEHEYILPSGKILIIKHDESHTLYNLFSSTLHSSRSPAVE